jgi:hypothetical protein
VTFEATAVRPKKPLAKVPLAEVFQTNQKYLTLPLVLDYNSAGNSGFPNTSARAMVKVGKITDGTTSSLTNKVGKL